MYERETCITQCIYIASLRGQAISSMLTYIFTFVLQELEWMLSRTGGFTTDLETDPRGPRIKDVMLSSLRGNKDSDDENSTDENDW